MIGQKHLSDRAGEKDTADADPAIQICSEQPGRVGGGTSHPRLVGFSSPDGAAAPAGFIEMLFQERDLHLETPIASRAFLTMGSRMTFWGTPEVTP